MKTDREHMLSLIQQMILYLLREPQTDQLDALRTWRDVPSGLTGAV